MKQGVWGWADDDIPSEFSMSSVKARMAARGGEIWRIDEEIGVWGDGTNLFIGEKALEGCADVKHGGLRETIRGMVCTSGLCGVFGVLRDVVGTNTRVFSPDVV